nr:MAG TPA: hypothetical protein [Caudoviricetes sp.]
MNKFPFSSRLSLSLTPNISPRQNANKFAFASGLSLSLPI